MSGFSRYLFIYPLVDLLLYPENYRIFIRIFEPNGGQILHGGDDWIGSSLIANFGLSPVLAFLVIGPMLDVKNLLMMKNYFKTRFIWQFISLVTVVVFLYSWLVGVVL